MDDKREFASDLQERMPPFSKLLGIRFLTAVLEGVTAELIVRDDLCTTLGTIHGGALMAFADTLGACATVINLRKGYRTTTLESKTNFFAPAPAGTRLLGECTALHRGKTTMVWQTRITNEEGRLIAVVTQTQIVLEAKPSA